MQDILRNNGDNSGGVGILYVIPVTDVISIPDAVAQIISSAITFAPYKTWTKIECTLESINFTEPQTNGDNGQQYAPTVTAFVANDSDAVAALFAEMENQEFILLINDSNEKVKLVGSVEEPMIFSSSLDTGTKWSDRNGHTINFAGDTSHKAYFYTA